MTLPTPNLDDRSWADLVREAKALVARRGSVWSDLSDHDPGVTLLEAFAHLTDVLLSRLNQVPEKLHVTFLNLLGATLRPPVAASVALRFERRAGDGGPIRIPRGTRVATSGAEAPQLFSTMADASLEPGDDHVEVRAVHGRLVDGALAGVGTGRPGLVVTVPTAPIPTGPAGAELLVAVEAPADRATRQVDGRAFAMWEERDGFGGADPADRVYVADRAAGRISFAPPADVDGAAALAAVPAEGAEIRVWCCDGGGDAGNVRAGSLTVLKDQVPGVSVTNPEPAVGGRDVESLEAALLRAGDQVQSGGRAVTARDYEQLAVRAGGEVSRARAFTRRTVWSFSPPGEVEVVLVPHVPPDGRRRGGVGLDALRARQTEEARSRVEGVLADRRPLGTTCRVTWCNYKVVSISARVVLQPGADAATVDDTARRRVEDLLSPLPGPASPHGRPFGEALRASNVYRALEVPGVRHVDRLTFRLDDVPDEAITGVARDEFQPDTYYAASGSVLHRTLDATRGWEPAGRFPDEQVVAVAPHPALAPGHSGLADRPGHVAVLTARGERSRLWVTPELGERWERVADLGFGATDVAWVERGGRPSLLVSSRAGLYEVASEPGASPVQALVVPDSPDLGLRAVEAFSSVRDDLGVAVVGDAGRGVHLSSAGGRSGSFHDLGMDADVRALTYHHDGPATWLWVGVAAPDEADRGGCARIRLDDLASGWEWFRSGWTGGTVRTLVVAGSTAYAGTQSGGILRLPLGSGEWRPAEVRSGMPLRDRGRFAPVLGLAVDHRSGLVVAGTEDGVLRSTDGGDTYAPAAQSEATDHVSLPSTWLFCSGEHDLTVEHDHGA